MNRFCIILYEHALPTKLSVSVYRAYNDIGIPAAPGNDFATLQRLVKEWGYIEVPINSKIGRQILEKIKLKNL